MKTIAYVGLFLMAFVLFQRCQPTRELQPTPDKNRSAKLISGSGYNLTFLGVTQNAGTYTWSYSLSRDVTGNDNLEAVYIPLGECLAGNVEAASITVIKDNKAGTPVGGALVKSIDGNQVAITNISGLGSQTWFISFNTTVNASTSPNGVTVVQKESGTPILYTDVIDTPGACTDVPPPAPCAFSQGYWFKKPGITWGGGDAAVLIIGGASYTKPEGVTIFNARGSKGNASVSNAFTQLAAMRLNYGANDYIPAPILASVKTLDAFLTGKQLIVSGVANPDIFKKTYPVPTEVKTAIKNVGNWICNNHCDDLYTDGLNPCDPTYLN